jgi:hypothetical protein
MGRQPISDAKQEKIKELAANGLTTREIANQVSINFSTVARYLKKAGLKTDSETTVTEQFDFEEDLTADETVVVTWAQNSTPTHRGFLQALQAYCKHHKARLMVIPGRYKNATSDWTASQKNEEWWYKDLVPYLYNQRTSLNANLMLLADISIQPTAVHPLSGMESLSHGESAILGHPKLELRTVATPQQRLPKIIATTGAITRQNYTNTKAGKKGDFHHVYGALVIERKGKIFYLRHLNARHDGAFCDLDKAYFPDGSIKPSGPYAGLVFGDIHVGACDQDVVDATFGQLVKKLNPEHLVLHDLLDAYSVNPHHTGNPFIAVAKRRSGLDNLQSEIESVIDWLRLYADRSTIVVPSNHDDMFARWMRRVDWREDPENAEFYLETALHMVKNLTVDRSGTKAPDPLKYWIDRATLPKVCVLERNQSHTIKGIEVGLHGHEGPDGRRGTMYNLSRLGVKVITGHSHSPGIEAGHYKTGTLTPLHLEYTGAVGSWLNAHVSIDPFGKRHLHIYVDGAFWK